MLETLAFSQFYNVLAFGGGLALWTVACWLVAPLGFTAPTWVHVLVPVTLGATNRWAASTLDQDPLPTGVAARAGRGLLVGAFAAIAGAATLAVFTAAWSGLASMGMMPADAGAAAAFGAPAFDPGFRIVATLAVLLAGSTVAHGYLRGQHAFDVTQVTVPVADLPAPLAGLRIVQLSDLHVGPLADRAGLRQAIDAAIAAEPDMVLVTGDIVDNPAADLASWLPELARVTAPLGVYAILGNHDRHVGADLVADALRHHTSWRVLRDEVATVDVDGARLHLIGLEDRRRSQAADALPALLATVPPGEPAVLLVHRPTVFPAAFATGIPLALSGHTHGGQIAIPGMPRLNPARLFMTPYDAGTFRRDRTTLHVSRGLGISGQPIRVAVPREIAVLTLVAA